VGYFFDAIQPASIEILSTAHLLNWFCAKSNEEMTP
jgi:hypothetical protein